METLHDVHVQGTQTEFHWQLLFCFSHPRGYTIKKENKCANAVLAYFHEPPSAGKWGVCWRGQVLKRCKGSCKPSPHHHPFVFLHICIFLCVLLTLYLCCPPAPRRDLSHGFAGLLSCFISPPLHSLETSQNNLPALCWGIQHQSG